MSVKVSQQQFHDRVINLLRVFSESDRARETARVELVRIFGAGWTDATEAVISEDRYVCDPCNRDFPESEMIRNEVCYSCESDRRAVLARA